MGVENQHLKHGKALCGKAFSNFVETFNALVDFMTNVKGDADDENGEGNIRFDRSNQEHPVIRCEGCSSEGGITVTDTDGKSYSGSSLVIISGEDSNVKVIGEQQGDDVVALTIDVYYK